MGSGRVLPRCWQSTVPPWERPCEERRLVLVGSGPAPTVGTGPDGMTCSGARAASGRRRARLPLRWRCGSSPRERVVLLSADPAHSLGDVLGTAVSNAPRRFPDGPGNLDVRELDAVLALRRAREEYASAIDALFDRAIGSGVDAAHDRRVMHGLIDLAPPGLDELVAILEVTTLTVGERIRDVAAHRARHSADRSCASSPRDAGAHARLDPRPHAHRAQVSASHRRRAPWGGTADVLEANRRAPANAVRPCSVAVRPRHARGRAARAPRRFASCRRSRVSAFMFPPSSSTSSARAAAVRVVALRLMSGGKSGCSRAQSQGRRGRASSSRQP